MSLRRAALLVCLIWAAIYLPALGSLEIKGEEGRRILPGLAMLRTGDWIVPQMAGVPYLRKPPLVNWAVALSVSAWGAVNEWTVRVPSALAMLVAALALLIGVGRREGEVTGFVAAVFLLTSLGMMEKGRLIEIEALYIACTAGALGFWLWGCSPTPDWSSGLGGVPGARTSGRAGVDPWVGWLGAGVCLGLGALAKGPLHLVFFYGAVVPVLAAHRRLRDLFLPAHLAGLIVMVGIFGLWAGPYLEATRALGSGRVWVDQFTGRLSGGGFRAGTWLVNFPRGAINFLPWAVFLPLALREAAARESRLLGWTCVALYLALMAVPESAPRYTFPVFPAVAWCLASVAVRDLGVEGRRIWARWVFAKGAPEVSMLAARSGAVMGALTLMYASVAVPFLRAFDDDRALGAGLSAAMPAGGSLVALDLGYRPFEFYLTPPVVHAPRLADIPADTRALLLETRRLPSVRALRAWRDAEERVRMRDGDGREWVVLVRPEPKSRTREDSNLKPSDP